MGPPDILYQGTVSYDSWNNSAFIKDYKKDESLGSSQWRLIRTPHDYPWVKHLKANSVFCVISSVHPGGLVQGLRVTLMYINGLAKGTDSDNVRHSGPDTSLSHQKRSLTSWNIYLKNKQLSHSCL